MDRNVTAEARAKALANPQEPRLARLRNPGSTIDDLPDRRRARSTDRSWERRRRHGMSKIETDIAAARRELRALCGDHGDGASGLERSKRAGRLHERLQGIRAEIESSARGEARQRLLSQVGEMEGELAPALNVSAEDLGALDMADYRRIRAAQGAGSGRW
jgi:hypothetical protein